MSNTKEFFLSVTQRIFSNWTALKVSTYFLDSMIYMFLMYIFCKIFFIRWQWNMEWV